jgi:Zn-dependent metalloprotease
MLGKIAEQGNAAQKEKALNTIKISGQIRGQRQSIAEFPFITAAAGTGKQRSVYDLKNGSTLPGSIVRKEGDPPVKDPAVNEAYDGTGATYDLYKDIYKRNSIDNKNMPLISSVHYLKGYDNAFWNGEQMVYGDGDEDLPVPQRLFNRFTIAIDVIGHELTHGVTQNEAQLVYWDQPGALNESLSDVFGTLVKQYQLKQTADAADWIIGEGLFTENVKGAGIRSMKAPGTAYNDPVLGKDPQPAHMKDFVNTQQDNGGVHINSGIPNHAFYVVAREIGGYAWEKAGQIWYVTLRDKLQQRSDFRDAANLTFQAAGELYGNGSLEQKAVKIGWEEVGIEISGDAKKGFLWRLAEVFSKK